MKNLFEENYLKLIKNLNIPDEEKKYYRFAVCKNNLVAYYAKKSLVPGSIKKRFNIDFFIINEKSALPLSESSHNVGGMTIDEDSYYASELWLTTIWVTDMDYRGMGIAPYAIKFSEEIAAKMDKRTIRAEHRPTQPSNSRDTYTKCGFTFYSGDRYEEMYKNVNATEVETNLTEFEGVKLYGDIKNWKKCPIEDRQF